MTTITQNKVIATLKTISENELVSLLLKKDKRSFEYLYENYSSAIYGVILRIIRSEDMAEEVLQDCFLKIWNKIEDFDPEKGKLFTWMINIARNMAIDKTRSRDFKNKSKSDDIDFVVDNENGNLSEKFKIEHIGVKDMLKELNPDQHQLLDLMYFKGYSQSEISEEFDIPLGTVKTRVRAAMNILKKFF